MEAREAMNVAFRDGPCERQPYGQDQLLVAYRGDECLGVRTARGWAAERGVKVETILQRASPSGRRRAGESGVRYYRTGACE